MSLDRAIGIICPDIWGSYFCEVLGGIHAVARQAGYRVIAFKGSPRGVHTMKLAEGQVDGWICVVDTTGIDRFVGGGRPVVTLSVHDEGAPFPYVLPDNHGGAVAVVRHLIEHGHTRIAFVGNMAHEDIRHRFQAYRDALAERGIPLDPDLVVEVPDNERAAGRVAARRILESGVPCTAMFVATDQGALGAMDFLREGGRRIPEDMAVAGFDDVEAARYATPPLTTVRQQVGAIGRTAAQLLLDQLAGREAASAGHVVPTTVVLRRSCGCAPAPPGSAPATPPQGAGAWADTLARELVDLVGFSAAIDRSAPPAQTWPGIADVITGLEAAAQGRPGPGGAALQGAWQHAVELAPDVDVLLMMLDRLEQAGQALLRSDGRRDGGAEERIAAYVRGARRDVMAGRVAAETARADYLNGLLDINLVVRETLLESGETGRGSTSKLSWLSAVQMSWGCLAMWDEPPGPGAALRVVESACPGEAAASPAPGTCVPASEFPPAGWLPAAVRAGGDHVLRLIPLRSQDRERGLLAVCAPVSSPLGLDHRDMDMWVAMLNASFERESLIGSLVEEEQRTRAAYERERALADAVRRLGCPVIRLEQGQLLVPLIGAIDPERASQVLEVVLAEIDRQGAEVLLMDITGVPSADVHVAQSLQKTARAALLLGAEVIVVGMRPQVAQGFTELGVDLEGMTLYATLGNALAALRRRRPRARPAPVG
ncbi:LacI family transcriptional regulator [Sorangium cellulosum]|uniref:LacI family transcriptional regulator n=1 Tax=Sorangium cellulosum TaxID=56 RepID=A0A2L0EMH1_SORCE|nr:substrate-binding domain-containing protein [Sorangium cellulosum]AUX40503.1 LacI family transcriptional regulator [Sorangium cellulosum]